MKYIIMREAEKTDIPGISKVHVDCWRTSYKGILPDEILKNLDYKLQEDKWNYRIYNKQKPENLWQNMKER